MRLPFLFVILLTFSIQISFAQSIENTESDNKAINSGITVNKTLGEFELYNYGQTTMTLKTVKSQNILGSYYYSILSLDAPPSWLEVESIGEVSIILTIDETASFLNRLSTMLDVGVNRDIKNPVERRLVNRSNISAGEPIWTQNKEFRFKTLNRFGHGVSFHLEADQTAENMDQTELEGTIFTSYGFKDFNVNDFNTYSRKVKRASESLLSQIRKLNKDPQNQLLNSKVSSGFKIDYRQISDAGYKIYKTNVHDTSQLEILADITLTRSSRKVALSDFENQFDDYTIEFDEQLNIYAVETVTFEDFLGEINEVLDSYQATGIMNMELHISDNKYKTTFTVVK